MTADSPIAGAADAVVLLAYHFHPSQEIGARRLTRLAQFLAAQGLQVIVISHFDGADFSAGREIMPGIIAAPLPRPATFLVDRLLALKRKINNSAEAAASSSPAGAPPGSGAMRASRGMRAMFFKLAYFIDPQKRWSLHASNAVLKLVRHYKVRVVVSSSPPHSTHLAAYRAARKLGVPFITDFRDPWLEQHADFEAGRASLHLRLTRAAERLVVRNAAAVVCTAPSLIERLATRHRLSRSRLHLVRNGFDGPIATPPMRRDRVLSVLYAGELYANRDPFPFLTALEHLLQRPDVDRSRVTVTFVGRCEHFQSRPIREWMRGRRCESVVSILPPVPVERLTEFVEQATVFLNLNYQGDLTIPAKTYDQIATGREVLLLCEEANDTAAILRGIRGVTRVDPSDGSALDQALWDLYRRHVIDGQIMTLDPLDVAKFSRKSAQQAFLEIIRNVIDAQGNVKKSDSSEVGG